MSFGKKCVLLAGMVLVPLLPGMAQPADQMLAAGRVDEAISSLQNQIHSRPYDAAAYNLLCRAYFTLSDWDSGIKACEKAVALDPSNSRYQLWLGRVYGEKADHASFLSAFSLAHKVREAFETAVRLDPNSADARTDLAEFYLEAPGILGGGKDKAEAQAAQLLRLDVVKAYWVTGRIAEKRKDLKTAEAEYRKAVQVSNGRNDAWFNLALFYRHVGRFDEMEDALRQIATSSAGPPEVMMEAAEMLIHTGRNTPAEKEFLRRYLASPTVEEAPAFKAHYLLGTVLEKQGDKLAAAQEYRASLSLAGSFSLARSALDRLN
jgi:tetratricopeptide (TPR) repeat protein